MYHNMIQYKCTGNQTLAKKFTHGLKAWDLHAFPTKFIISKAVLVCLMCASVFLRHTHVSTGDLVMKHLHLFQLDRRSN